MEIVYVTLVNRSSKDLTGRYDGKEHTIKAGSRTSLPMHLATKFRDQNPVMGSENYYSMDKQYLLGIEEFNDPIDPIEQTDAQSLIDYATLPVPPGAKLEVLPGRSGNPRSNFNRPIPANVVGFEANTVPLGAKADSVQIDEAPISVASATPAFEKP